MLIRARWLFDGSDVVAQREPTVEVRDGRIARLLEARAMPEELGPVVDLGDVTLMPGLIDSHQHLGFDASSSPVESFQAASDAMLLLRMRAAARRALRAGITTVRDLGDRSYLAVELRDWFGQGSEVGPTILAAGPPITITNGHCWFMGGQADGAEGVLRAVRDHVAHGVDVIKIMVTGGNMTPTTPVDRSQYTLDEIRTAVDEAHAHGLLVAAHGHGTGGIADALAAGVDSIEHCSFRNGDGIDVGHQTLADVARSETYVSLTGGRLPSIPVPPGLEKRRAAARANNMQLYKLGARIICGTDAGIGRAKPHDVLPYGVSTFLPSIGMSTIEVLRAVTSVAARACGVAHCKGTIAAGMDADLLAVNGNLTEDLSRIHDVAAVFARGRQVPRLADCD